MHKSKILCFIFLDTIYFVVKVSQSITCLFSGKKHNIFDKDNPDKKPICFKGPTTRSQRLVDLPYPALLVGRWEQVVGRSYLSLESDRLNTAGAGSLLNCAVATRSQPCGFMDIGVCPCAPLRTRVCASHARLAGTNRGDIHTCGHMV